MLYSVSIKILYAGLLACTIFYQQITGCHYIDQSDTCINVESKYSLWLLAIYSYHDLDKISVTYMYRIRARVSLMHPATLDHCGSFKMFFSVLCLLCLCVRLYICALLSPTGKGLASRLLFMVAHCKCVTLLLVSCVRCGTWLYRFLIFAPLLTLNARICTCSP